MKYRILVVCNNANGNEDAVGKHGKMLSEQFVKMGHESVVLSGKSGFGKYFSFLTLIMSWVLFKAAFYTIKRKYDFVIVEYPFKEHNPLIVLFYLLLFGTTKLSHTKLLLSMHEYDRVNVLRKKVLDVFMRFSDWIFVSEEKYLNKFGHLSKKMSIRSIPNHIVCERKDKVYNPHAFCYMGLVNKSKAFGEMLKAWESFNEKGENILDIISSSDLSEWHLERYKGIRYHHNITNAEMVDVMFSCAFAIVPILPEIGYNNSSFVSAIQCGCLPIGKFGVSLKDNQFALNVMDYSVDSMVKTLCRAQQITNEEFYRLSQMCFEFGKQFSLENTALQMIESMSKIK